jgi:phage shock protein PspC (stress-responsive transcriptional regulator)
MTENVKRLYRSRDDRMIAGICGGLGDYLGIDSTLVRLLFVFGAIFTGSALFWGYVIMLIVVPEEPIASQAVVEAAPAAPVAPEPVLEESTEEEIPPAE